MQDFLITFRLEAAAREQGVSLAGAQPLAGDGSDRRFFRLPGSPTKVLLWHPYAPGREVNENDSYFRIGGHLRAQDVPVPEIFHYCREEGWMILEDLGDMSLEAVLKTQKAETQIRFWYRQALEILAQMQVRGLEGFSTAWCFDTPVVDAPFLKERECGYFVAAFLQGYLGLTVDPAALAPDFERLAGMAAAAKERYFVHRDFQSRNLMIKNGRLRVIDFQGARLGPWGYDVAALLIDPYVGLETQWQEEFLGYYLEELQKRVTLDEAACRQQYHYLALSRNLQILGAFGFLTKVKKKPYFSRYIPTAVASLKRRLEARPGEFPELEKVAAGL
ncbi:MAG: aminoglycoside phosphotransferase family protein [Desulfobaccales bacterium]